MIKLRIRCITISHSSYKKRLKEREANDIEEQIAKLQKVLNENPTNGIREEIENLKKKAVEEHKGDQITRLTDQVQNKMEFTRRKKFKILPQPGKTSLN